MASLATAQPTRALALLLLLALLSAATDCVQASQPSGKTIEKLKKPSASKPVKKPVPPTYQQHPDDEPDRDYSTDLFVDGYVYCAPDCVGRRKAAPKLVGKSVKGAIVGLTCTNLYGLKTDFGSAKTDAKGYFLVDLAEYDLAAFGVSQCRARVITAPGPDCRFVSDVNKGHSGAPLTKKKKVGQKVIYTVGPFFTVPNKCGSVGY